MKNHITLVNNHTLFVEGASDRITAAQILEENTNQSPVGLMFASDGVLSLKNGENRVLNVPYRKIRLEDPNVVVQNMLLDAEGTALEGVGIGLPDDVVRLHAAWVAANAGMPYNWDTFLTDYLGDLERIATLFMEHIDTARIDGLMAQAITDPRVGDDEVGLSLTLAKKLHKILIAAGHEELVGCGHLDRMNVLLQGYPVVSKTGGRWVKLRLIKGAAADKVLVNAKTWKELHQRDEDGDGAFVGINRVASFGTVQDRLPDYPALKVISRDDLPETTTSDPVQTVMNMHARSLIGSQHTFFHGIARAAAVKLHRKDGKEGFARATRGVFTVYEPMAEGVFDKRKDEGGGESFNQLVWAMEDHLAGKTVPVDPFKPFLDEALYARFVSTMELVGHSTRLARGTAFGRYLMASNKVDAKKRALGVIVDALTAMKIEPVEMIEALQADGLGEKILPIEMPQTSSKRKKQREEVKLSAHGEIESTRDVFENITLGDRSVLKWMGEDAHEDGSLEVGVRLIPVWNAKLPSVVISIEWPSVTPVSGLPRDEHHRLIKVEGMQTRMFCPIFRMVNEKVGLVDFPHWFSEMVAEGITTFAQRRNSKDQEKFKKSFQSHMDRHVRAALRNLIVINEKDKEAGQREILIRMSEYRVDVAEGTMSQKAANMQTILTKLHEMGLDVVTTSKNKPGTIVTKPWKRGVPRFIWAINPFADQLDVKRRVEPREVRKALEFLNPIAPPLKTKGAKIPSCLADVITTLNVAVMDLEQLNNFMGSDGKLFCFDTLLVTASGIEKLKLKKLIFHADDSEQRDRIIKKLKSEGFEKIEVEEIVESSGEGLHHLAYDIVAIGEIEDIGKIKACVGPIKGVMNPVPFDLFSVDEKGNKIAIDLIVPHHTIVKKRAVDAVSYMMAANAGLTEIDPENQPELEVIKRTIVTGDGTVLGEFISGPLPFFRPVQTGRSTTDIRTGEHGIKVHYHTMIMAGGVDYHNTPEWVKQDFAALINCRKAVKQEMVARTMAAQEEEAPMGEEPVYVEQ